MIPEPIRVLLVDDCEDDVVLVQEAADRVEGIRLVGTVRNGAEVLPYLEARGTSGQEGRPELILLDLNMPQKNGFEILSELKSDSRFRDITVRVLTTSDREEDIEKALALGAQAYTVKPFGFTGSVNFLREVVHTSRQAAQDA